MATGLSKTPCIPSIADCGGLMIGVPNIEPYTPPLLMVNVPPSMSSTANLPSFACNNNNRNKKLKIISKTCYYTQINFIKYSLVVHFNSNTTNAVIASFR